MNIMIQVSDKVYQQLVAGGKRIEGSIGLVSPTEGNFNAYTRQASTERDTIHQMAHGRLRISQQRTSLRLWFNHGEEPTTDVPLAIEDEAMEAAGFAYRHEQAHFA